MRSLLVVVILVACTPPPAVAPSRGTLVRSDDFTDAVDGLSLDAQSGSAQATLSDGSAYPFRWEYRYAERALLARIAASYPDLPGNHLTKSAPASGQLQGDFAIEVRARGTRSPEAVQYGIQYVLGSAGDVYQFAVEPFEGSALQWSAFYVRDRHSLASGRSGAVSVGTQENALRLELRRSAATFLVNGVVVARVEEPGLSRRGGTAALEFAMARPAPERQIEIRFTEFREYSLP